MLVGQRIIGVQKACQLVLQICCNLYAFLIFLARTDKPIYSDYHRSQHRAGVLEDVHVRTGVVGSVSMIALTMPPIPAGDTSYQYSGIGYILRKRDPNCVLWMVVIIKEFPTVKTGSSEIAWFDLEIHY